MLLRQDDRGVLAIGQPAHAWLSGQLARAWGNQRFGTVEPREEVCLAADQHDAGWRTIDLEPTYNPETGLPRSFMEFPLHRHLELFTEGPRSLVSQNRYVALLVSMHGQRLYERRDLSRFSSEDAEAVRGFLAGQATFQEELKRSLSPDPRQLERGSLLVWTWDYLSLALCHNWSSVTAEAAPTATAPVDIRVEIEGDLARLDPWPFSDQRLTVRTEGRRLSGRFESEEDMRRAFASAPWEELELALEPRG
jgi:hypothetical protein